MSDKPIVTRPPSDREQKLLDAFQEDLVKQVDRLDDLNRDLLKLSLALPGLFVAAAKLAGTDAQPSSLLPYALALWLLALLCAWTGLFPRRYRVVPDGLYRVGPDAGAGDPLTLEEFYAATAKRKFRWFALGTLLFLAGTVMAGLTLYF